MVPDLTRAVLYFTFFMIFPRGESSQTSILHFLRKDFITTNLTGFKPLQLFSVEVLKG
jgi:hypothetical protein